MKKPVVCPFCEIMHTTQVPCITLNGTSPEELMQRYQPALDTIHAALYRKLREFKAAMLREKRK